MLPWLENWPTFRGKYSRVDVWLLVPGVQVVGGPDLYKPLHWHSDWQPAVFRDDREAVWIDPNQQENANRVKSQHSHGFNVVTSVCETLSTWTTVQISHTCVHKCSCQFLCYNAAKPTPFFNLFGITPTLVRGHCSSFLCTTPRELLRCLIVWGWWISPSAIATASKKKNPKTPKHLY